MKKILLLNGGKQFAHSDGRYNATLHDAAVAFLKGTIVLKPLPGLPVIRDLIVDMTQFFKQYNSIKPYLINDNLVAPDRERLQSPEESCCRMAQDVCCYSAP